MNTNLVASLAEVTKDKATQRGASEKHEIMSWIAYYDNQYRIHLSEKNGAGWFPQGKIMARSFRRHKEKLGKALAEIWDSIPSQYPEDDQYFYINKQSTSSYKFITLDVWIQGYKARTVIDSRCTGNKISPKFVKKIGIPRYDRAQKVYLSTFDGSLVKENGGTIREKIGKIGLKIGKYEKKVKFDIIITQGYDITLGFS
jgi:hypothetical protein